MKALLCTLGLLAVTPIAFADSATTADNFKLIHTAELAPLVSHGAPVVYVFDANGNDLRKEEGMIPGAVALSSFDGYDVKVLPVAKSSKLVFYCANEQCGASHAAAKRALGAGYTDVSVLSDGIMGWKKNGQKTARFKLKKA